MVTPRVAPVVAIARPERRRLLRDGRFVWAADAFLLLLACSTSASVVETRRSIRAAETQSRAERERWLNQGDKRPSLAGDQGIVVFQTISTLHTFDPGVLPYVGSSTLLNADDETLFSSRSAAQSNTFNPVSRITQTNVLLTGDTLWNPAVFVTASTVLLFVSLLSTAAPARRAAKVDPSLALRAD